MKGKKIHLRAVEPTDLDAMFQWENDTENWLVSNTTNPFSRHVLEQYVLSVHDLIKDGQARFIICSNEDDSPIGAIDLFELDMTHRRVGVGILVDKDHRVKGIASDAIQIVIRHCFTTLGLHQIYCNILADNKVSMKLFESNGFKISGVKKEWLWHEGQWKDEHILQLVQTT